MAVPVFALGDRVQTHGLSSAAGKAFNGEKGIIKSARDPQTGRYQVSFQTKKLWDCKAFKPENLRLCYVPGDKVVAHGLKSASGQMLNGADGIVESHDEEADRYQVLFETHGSKALRADNLRLRQLSGGPGAARGLAPRPKPCSPAGPPAAAAWAGGAAPSTIAEACEAAARGATSGETVQDTDIRVLDPNEVPVEPEIYTSFDQCVQFPGPVVAELRKAGFPGPSQIQGYAWPLALQGKDVIGIAATGSGKTLAFLLPSFCVFFESGHQPLQDGVGLLVMSPTRELAQQIEVEANRFGKCIGISVVSMYGGAPKWEQVQAYKRGVHAIIACPGRLNDCLEGGQVSVDWVKMLVLDEADRMLDMGFEPQIKTIIARLPAARHTMFFTATWPREVRQLASTMLRNPYRVMIGNRENLKANQDVVQEVRIVEGRGKEQALQELLSEAGLTQPGAIGKCLVFVGTKRMCEEISVNLCRAGVQCASIHGDKDQFQRDQALANLKSGYYRVLAATDVAARGLDIKGIGLVINYDIPNNTEDYVHRIGRTGRAGAKGYAVTFVTRNDGGKISGIIKIMEGANQDIPPEIRALSRGGGGGGGNRGGGGGGGWGGGGGSCVWCAKGECWTHGGKGKGRSRSPKGHG